MHLSKRRNVLLVQLPIPPLGPGGIRGNVPLAAGYLKLYADTKGLDALYDIAILPAGVANTFGDRALVERIVDLEPWLVGFTCYLWNIERTLWLVREIKRRLPAVRIVLGGPEITPDNSWVLDTPEYDFAVIGEGEQTFAQLLFALLDDDVPPAPIAGLYVPPAGAVSRFDPARRPAFRTPMPDLNQLGSPYLTGILDAANEQMLLLETTRGCVFKCKFCYYPKSYDKQYYLAPENILANLRHAAARGAREIFLLDPTLNQRKDFADLLRLLAEGNPGRQFSYFGELRGEGVTEETARLLREANFTEVEVGLQSIDAEAQTRMDRKNNLKAFERGVRAMMRAGIRVKVDLIVGLPGDTAESVRLGMRYLKDNGLYDDVQVFNLSILPGTAFRQEAGELGLHFQPRPPYYVLRTPTLKREDLFGLMHEAQQLFEIEFDAQPPPVLSFDAAEALLPVWRVHLDCRQQTEMPVPRRWAQAFTLWLISSNFARAHEQASACIRRVLDANPFTTLQVVLDLSTTATAETAQNALSRRALTALAGTCLENPTYLDRYYALQPGRPNGAKRLIVILPARLRGSLAEDWLDDIEEIAAVVWHRTKADPVRDAETDADEYTLVS